MLEEAAQLLRYASSILGYPYPDDLPEIRLEPDLECHGIFRRSWLHPPVISLRDWREGNLEDRATLAHELAHWTQHVNGVELNEVEAITVECRWLQSKGQDPRDYMSQASVLHMSKSEEFAKLEWL